MRKREVEPMRQPLDLSKLSDDEKSGLEIIRESWRKMSAKERTFLIGAVVGMIAIGKDG